MKFIILYFLLIFVAYACEDSLNIPVEVNNLDQEFEIRPWQSLSSEEPDYQLIIQTVEEQECLNSALDLTEDLQGNLITVRINGITTQGDCIKGSAYPEAALTLPSESGTYELELQLGSTITNMGSVEISDNQMNLEIEEENGIHSSQDSVLKIPEGITWGYIDNRVIGEPEVDNMTSQIFREIDEISTNMPEGNYGHFVIGDFNVVEIYGADQDVTSMVLDTRPVESWQELKTILAEFENKFPDLRYEFTRWDGLQIWN